MLILSLSNDATKVAASLVQSVALGARLGDSLSMFLSEPILHEFNLRLDMGMNLTYFVGMQTFCLFSGLVSTQL